MNDMYEPFVEIAWSPLDLQLKYGFSDEESIRAAGKVSKALFNRSIELGWEIIDSVIGGEKNEGTKGTTEL